MTEIRGKIIPLKPRDRRCFWLNDNGGCDLRAVASDASGQPMSSFPRPTKALSPKTIGIGSDRCSVQDNVGAQKACNEYTERLS